MNPHAISDVLAHTPERYCAPTNDTPLRRAHTLRQLLLKAGCCPTCGRELCDNTCPVGHGVLLPEPTRPNYIFVMLARRFKALGCAWGRPTLPPHPGKLSLAKPGQPSAVN